MALSKKLDVFLEEKFTKMSLKETIGDRFGRYSKYIIQERAIPDIRDGLKPVQRRILYAMNDLGIKASSSYKKSAKICGEVMGKYHPHGDSSIYEAMVRMSQDWKMGTLLIDMHGNNGSIDGDSPAAMRYTEARLAKITDFLLADIDKETVLFIPNFDEEEVEPVVLPAKFPNLLINGSQGISSGYATNIPPHNFNEVLNAAIALIDNPSLSLDELLSIMPGPDFPTGGIVTDIDGIKEAFLTGQGKISISSKYEIETFGSKQKRIVITEIPYDVLKSSIVEKIEDFRIDNVLPDILDVRDESDRNGLRIAIDLKQNANLDAIVTYLLKNTQLQVRYSYNMVAISNKRPVTAGVLTILNAYIEHQKEVITNRTIFLLNKAKKRLHIVIGLIKMVSILDAVIKTIRQSQNKQDSIINLVKEFQFTELQSEAIVTMQLYRLSNTDIKALEEEEVTLNSNIKIYEKILNSEKELLKVIRSELVNVNKSVTLPRRTVISTESFDLSISERDLVSDEVCYIVITKNGYLKRLSEKNYNMSKVNYTDNKDSIFRQFKTNTLDILLLFSDLGNYIYLPVYKIPECKARDQGEFINSLVQIDPKEQFINAFVFSNLDADYNLLFTTNLGNLKQHKLALFKASRYTKAIRAMRLALNERVVSVSLSDQPLEIFLLTKMGQGLRFPASDVSLRDTLNTGGIKGLNLGQKDEVVGAIYTNREEDLVFVTDNYKFRRIRISDFNLTKRARATSEALKFVKSNPAYITAFLAMSQLAYKENVNLNLITSSNNFSFPVTELKYGFPNSGKLIIDNIDNPIISLYLDETSRVEYVDPSYLETKKETLFTRNTDNVLADLDQILEENKEGTTFFKLDLKVEE